ncbi:MAG: CoA pyrophosphatase [Gemmatimonadota bacterium]|nr:CoA pyrophosphatase [Gemmatimonadota bacterium]
MSVIPLLEEALHQRAPRTVADPTRFEAGVAVVLIPENDQLLLIRRAEHPRDPWSGQMGLPGGRRDPEDQDLLATAIRETREEVGLDLSQARLLGALDDQAPSTPVLPPIIVRPHVFLLPSDPGELRLSAEVQYVRWASLGELRRPEVLRPYSFDYGGSRITRPGYHLGPDVVWGMTERILTPLLGLLTSR